MAQSVAAPTASRTIESSERRGVSDRRRQPTPLLSRHALFGGRRTGDRRTVGSPNQYVDRYESWLVGALVAISALCALDAVFTLLYIQKGGSEANPVMAAVIEWGPRPFLILKCVVTNLGLMILCLHKNFRYVKAVICSLLGIYGLLLVYHLWLAAVVK